MSRIETWRDVPGEEGRYQISDLGRVRSYRRSTDGTPRLLRCRADGAGYLTVGISTRTRLVHRLVLEAFAGRCPAGHESAHLNGIRSDNRAANLAWKTHRENERDKHLHGTAQVGDRNPARLRPETRPRGDANGSRKHPETRPRGEQNGLAKLTTAAVLEIRAAATFREAGRIGARYGVGESAVRAVVQRQTWRHVAEVV